MSKTKETESSELVGSIVRGIQEVKGKEICAIDLRGIQNAVTEFFVVCHGSSDTQVEAIARSVEKIVLKETEQKPFHREGTEKAGWILLDYFDVVVHVFLEETRRFYHIEKLWADADVKEIEYQI